MHLFFQIVNLPQTYPKIMMRVQLAGITSKLKQWKFLLLKGKFCGVVICVIFFAVSLGLSIFKIKLLLSHTHILYNT